MSKFDCANRPKAGKSWGSVPRETCLILFSDTKLSKDLL